MASPSMTYMREPKMVTSIMTVERKIVILRLLKTSAFMSRFASFRYWISFRTRNTRRILRALRTMKYFVEGKTTLR